MIRYAVEALFLLALAVAPAAAQDLPAEPPIPPACEDWSGMSRIDQGTLRGLPPGPVRWRVGLSPAGWSHQDTAVEIAWTAEDGQARRQTLFGEIQDGRPSLRVRRGRLELRVTYCERGGGCRGVTLPYAWRHATRRFVGLNATARDALEASCTPVPVPATGPARP